MKDPELDPESLDKIKLKLIKPSDVEKNMQNEAREHRIKELEKIEERLKQDCDTYPQTSPIYEEGI